MKFNSSEVDSFAQSTLKTFNLNGINIDTKKALAEIQKEIELDLDELNTDEVKEIRHERMQVGTANDYAEHLINLDNSNKVICGIRFIGGDPKLPFVNLTANFQITSKAHGQELYQKLASHFKVFSPLYFCFWTPKQIDADMIGSVYLVSSAKQINKRRPWDIEKDLELVQVTNSSYYSWYEMAYEDFHAEKPDLKSKVTLNSRSTMDESLKEGLLYFAKINGESIGLIAAVRRNFLGSAGIYFNEILIDRKWIGKGFAKAIQRKFVATISEDEEMIWGTIDHNNLPSFKTATSNGRIPIRYENFVKLV